MVIRLDSNRVKDVVNKKSEHIGVDGDPASRGMSEADKIVEDAQKNIASQESNNKELAEQAGLDIPRKSSQDQKPGSEPILEELTD
jgi:protein phosphatase PTC1